MTSPTEPRKNENWPSETLDFAIRELCKEYPHLSRERIVRSLTAASRHITPENGRVRLLQKAREQLRG